jgi:2-dehydro-3-deoxygluconokinase
MAKTTGQFDVTSLGSTMIRLSVPPGKRLETASSYEVRTAGTESNTLVALSRMGRKTAWISRLCDNALGQRIAHEIQSHGVDTSHIIWTKKTRNEVFFVEYGTSPRGINVIYDRAGSAISQIIYEEIDMKFLLNTKIVHFTGIFPALSEGCQKVLDRAINTAKQANVKISFDVNYRSKLWQPQQASKVLRPLMKKCNILFITSEDAKDLFNISGSDKQTARSFYHMFNPDICVVTLAGRGGIAFDGSEFYFCKGYQAEPIDRLGAGDCFTAGFLCGYLEGSIQNGMNYASAMAALKLSIHGDYFVSNKQEVLELINSAGAREVGR